MAERFEYGEPWFWVESLTAEEAGRPGGKLPDIVREDDDRTENRADMGLSVLDDLTDEDAQRIVAAVNACAGLPQATLAALPPGALAAALNLAAAYERFDRLCWQEHQVDADGTTVGQAEAHLDAMLVVYRAALTPPTPDRAAGPAGGTR